MREQIEIVYNTPTPSSKGLLSGAALEAASPCLIASRGFLVLVAVVSGDFSVGRQQRRSGTIVDSYPRSPWQRRLNSTPSAGSNAMPILYSRRRKPEVIKVQSGAEASQRRGTLLK